MINFNILCIQIHFFLDYDFFYARTPLASVTLTNGLLAAFSNSALDSSGEISLVALNPAVNPDLVDAIA